MSYLQNIAAPGAGSRMGGILTLAVVRKADVTNYPTPVNGVVTGSLTLRAGASWARWVVGFQSAGMSSNARNNREGASKANSLPFFLPLDLEGVRLMLQRAEEDEFIVVYVDATGRQKIFGTLTAPARFEFSHESGTAPGDRNGNNCSFFYTGPDNTYFYDADSPAPGVGPAPAVVSFNGVPIASLTPGQTLNILSDYDYTEYFVTE